MGTHMHDMKQAFELQLVCKNALVMFLELTRSARMHSAQVIAA
jgi:hypothetical protein